VLYLKLQDNFKDALPLNDSQDVHEVSSFSSWRQQAGQ